MKTEHAAVAAIIRKELRRRGITGTVKSRGATSTGPSLVAVAVRDIPHVVVRELETFCRQYEYGWSYENRADGHPEQVQFISVLLR